MNINDVTILIYLCLAENAEAISLQPNVDGMYTVVRKKTCSLLTIILSNLNRCE